MRKMLIAIIAGLLLALPAACMHHGHRGGPDGPDCRKHQGCDCKCRQQPDGKKTSDCPDRPDCPQHRQQEPTPPAK